MFWEYVLYIKRATVIVYQAIQNCLKNHKTKHFLQNAVYIFIILSLRDLNELKFLFL